MTANPQASHALHLLRSTPLQYPLPQSHELECIGITSDDNALWFFVDGGDMAIVLTVQNQRTYQHAQIKLRPSGANFLKTTLFEYAKMLATVETNLGKNVN